MLNSCKFAKNITSKFMNTSTFRCFVLAFGVCLLCNTPLGATHYRAGEIHVEQIGPLTVKVTVMTWTKIPSSVNRDTIEICWGDNKCEKVPCSNGNGQGVAISESVRYNEYEGIHTFAGPGTYQISSTDQNRTADIVNVNPPNSQFIPFHVATTYTFQDVIFGGSNTTPRLLQPPIDNACLGKPFKHNPNAFDPDGDSLSYALTVPLQGVNSEVPNYSFPNQIIPGGNNFIQIDAITGDFIWNSPQLAGEYNVAFIVVSWRNGLAIDTTIRDMQITVRQCDNNPPVVMAPETFCVVAGDTLRFEVTANDPDTGDLVRLTALGGPLSTPYSPAVFTVPANAVAPPVTGMFFWATDCEHISDQPYTVVFKAADSTGGNQPSLVDLKTTSIKVVGPPPLDVQAITGQGEVEVTWAKPYTCETTDNNLFYAFSVWRREGSNPFMPDSCQTGLAGRGYTEIVSVTRNEQNGRYYFKDENVQRGRTYCYRILAKFARISAGGNPYNIVESLPSKEVCVQLPRDLPIVIKASVLTTSNTTGQVELCWTKPLPADLDTLLNPGPYRYQVLRGNGFSGALTEVPGASFSAPTFSTANDTCFTDTGLNTAGGLFNYAVAFYVGNNANVPLGTTNPASTVFLNIQSTDNRNNLTWNEAVPWGNYLYEVYRFDASAGDFTLLGTTPTQSYTDTGLDNGVEYCYKVRSVGSYGVDGIVSPLFNWSQERCGTPLDTVPPCLPTLTISNRCLTGESIEAPDPPYENLLTWNNPISTCPSDANDIARYFIWYAPESGQEQTLIHTAEGADNLRFTHSLPNGLNGCYAISVEDLNGNESPRSVAQCVDNCPEYELPNTFTPNGDGANDLFTPYPGWRFIERVEFQVFNRLGNLVFETSDPALNWNGTDSGGQRLNDGTYYYVCRVFEQRVTGVVQRGDLLRGWIEIIGGRN
jgi:gliding motility-associated-like protein